MRHDMSKVIVERPRRGGKTGGHHPYRRAKQLRLEVDEDGQLDVADQFTTGQSGRSPIKPGKILGWDCKELNENLSPLWRFLDKQVGRRWDDVYSEVCEHINVSSTVQQHILVHLYQHVELHTELRDGKVFCKNSYGWHRGERSLEEPRSYGQLYVHPVTGILCASPLEPRWRINQRPPKKEVFFISDTLGFVKDNGVWFRVVFELATDENRKKLKLTAPYRPTDIFGVELNLDYIFRFTNDLKAQYGRAAYAVSKQSANRREIKRYKLNQKQA